MEFQFVKNLIFQFKKTLETAHIILKLDSPSFHFIYY